jgi:RimJ/RimL family protein N-acetyltransferase
MQIRLELLEEDNYSKIVEWNKGKDADFLYQWAGPGYVFPISEEQIAKRIKKRAGTDEAGTFIYKILNEYNIMLGTIELFNINRKKQTATIARFLIDENFRGQGLGEKSLRLLLEKAFTEFDINEIDLRVFDFNRQAISCYEKVGFEKTRFESNIRQTLNDCWGVYEMKVKRNNYAMK